MVIHPWAWGILALVAIGLVVIDFLGHARNPHPPTAVEAARWTLFYVGLAGLFGVGIWLTNGGRLRSGVLCGMGHGVVPVRRQPLRVHPDSQGVPRSSRESAESLAPRHCHRPAPASRVYPPRSRAGVALLVGVLHLRTLAAVDRVQPGSRDSAGSDEDEEYHESGFIRAVRRVLPITDGFIGNRMLFRHGGRTYITPMLVVVLALGSADLMFAFDSIPAIFGITQQAFLVFACNVFALMGLRQLFFLVDALLSKLVYLGYGLGVILSFIGIKLILEALHANTLPFINGGSGVEWTPEISVSVSLGVIVVTLAVTVVASLIRSAMDEGDAHGN